MVLDARLNSETAQPLVLQELLIQQRLAVPTMVARLAPTINVAACLAFAARRAIIARILEAAC